MKHYLVSIIIPVYNVETYVRDSLSSALNQTFESIEYIIVDDCATDKSMDLVRKMIDKHRRKDDVHIYQHKQNLGLSVARNTGLEKASGKYIFFMDSDDEITTDCIEKHYIALTRKDANFSIANINLVGAKSIHIKDFPQDCPTKDLLASFFLREWNVSACNKLYLREFLLQNNLLFKKGLLQEDILWSYQLCLSTNSVAWINDRTYIYKIRENSITRSKNSPHKIKSLIFILSTMVSDWEKETINHKYVNEFTYMINFYRLNTSLLLLNYSGSNKEALHYFNQLNTGRLASFTSYSLQAILLKLPFPCFKILLSPIYFLYKYLNK